MRSSSTTRCSGSECQEDTGGIRSPRPHTACPSTCETGIPGRRWHPRERTCPSSISSTRWPPGWRRSSRFGRRYRSLHPFQRKIDHSHRVCTSCSARTSRDCKRRTRTERTSLCKAGPSRGGMLGSLGRTPCWLSPDTCGMDRECKRCSPKWRSIPADTECSPAPADMKTSRSRMAGTPEHRTSWRGTRKSPRCTSRTHTFCPSCRRPSRRSRPGNPCPPSPSSSSSPGSPCTCPPRTGSTRSFPKTSTSPYHICCSFRSHSCC